MGVTAYDAAVLVADPSMTRAFEAISGADPSVPAKEVSNFVSGVHARVAKASGLNDAGTAGASTPAGIAALLGAITGGRVPRQVGRELLERHLADGTPSAELIAGAGPAAISDETALLGHIEAVLAANPRVLEDHRAGRAGRRVRHGAGDEGDRGRGGCLAGRGARPGPPGSGGLRMGFVSLAMIVVGVALIAVGAVRARDPYRRYMALKEQDANIARYEAWRGGARPDGRTGASVAMEMLRRRMQVGGAIVIAGFLCVIAGFVIR